MENYLADQRDRSLLQSQQTFDEIQVGLADLAFFSHDTLAFLGFLGENVTFESFLEGDLPGAGHFKPLLGTRIRSNLRHFDCFCMKP